MEQYEGKEVICFGTPDGENGYLSNGYAAAFNYSNNDFSCVDQYFTIMKAIMFGDNVAIQRIASEENAAEMWKIGRDVINFNDALWAQQKVKFMTDALAEKFSQNAELAAKLVATGDSVIAACIADDSVWGTGKSMEDPDKADPSTWTGQNLLGQILVLVRNALKAEAAATQTAEAETPQTTEATAEAETTQTAEATAEETPEA